MGVQLKKQSILLGVRIFVVLTLLGIVIIFYLTGTRQTWVALQHFRLRYFLLACLLVLVDLFSGASRLYVFVRKIRPQKSFAACFKANLANIFLGAATPFATGGGVAQLYVLNQNGIPYAAGLTVSVLNFVATLSMLFITATIILTTLPNRFAGNHPLFVLMDVSRFAFYFTLMLFLLFMIRPSAFGRWIQALFGLWSRWLRPYRATFTKWGEKIVRFIQQYRSYLRYYWREEKIALLLNYLLTIVLYFNKCLVAYVIFRGLGVHPDFWEVMMLQVLVVFFLYFAPTPGASLIGETTTSAVMSLIVPTYLLPIFAVLWRFFTTYFGVILGGFVLLKAIGEFSSFVQVHPDV